MDAIYEFGPAGSNYSSTSYASNNYHLFDDGNTVRMDAAACWLTMVTGKFSNVDYDAKFGGFVDYTQEQYSNLIGQNTVSQLWKTVIVKLPEDCRPISNGMTLEAALKEMTDFWDHQSLPCGDSIACEQGGTKEVKCRLSIRASATLILAVCQRKGLVHGHRQPPGEKQAQIDMYEFWRRYFLIHHRVRPSLCRVRHHVAVG